MSFSLLKKILFISSSIVFSCEQINTNTKNEKNKYIQQLTQKDSLIKVLMKEVFIEKKRADSIKNFFSQKHIKEDYACFRFKKDNLLLEDGNFLLDKGSLVNLILNKLELHKKNIMSQLFNTSFLYTSDDSDYYIRYKYIRDRLDIINILWNRVDRSPESISRLLSENDKLIIYSIFKDNTIYEDSGMSSIVEGLLTSYDEIENNELSKFYFLELKWFLYNNPDSSERYNESYRITNELLASDSIKDILSEEKYTSYANSESDIHHRISYVYSFWCRRYTEGNQDIVYRLLNEFHQNVSKNKKNKLGYNKKVNN